MVYDTVLDTITKNNMIEEGDRIIVGLSGGPDSVCLLHVLHRLSLKMNIRVYAVHLNHQIRGLDAHLDALYVSKLCHKLGIACFIRSIDVPKYCSENGLGLEDGARNLRYMIFKEVKDRIGANKIAVGHNKNDQAETVIMRIMRGTGIKGLSGMDYVRSDGVIRPILDLDRSDIESYCKDHSLTPRIDSTNLEAIYSRNKIRLKIIPYMRDEFNENIIDTLVRMSRGMKMDNDYIDSQAQTAYKMSSKKYTNGVYLFTDQVRDQHEAIRSRMVILAIQDILSSVKSFDKKHFDDVLGLLDDSKIDKQIDLPRGLIVYRKKDYLLFTKEALVYEEARYDYEVDNEEEVFVREIGKVFKTRTISIDEFDKDKIKDGIQYIDIDKLKGKLRLRNRYQGDKIRLVGGSKKIKDLFISMKLPKEKRSYVPILLDGDTVVAVCGHRVSVDYKVDEDTKRILEFRLEDKI